MSTFSENTISDFDYNMHRIKPSASVWLVCSVMKKMWLATLQLCLLIHLSSSSIELKFPPWFKFGSSSSSFQIEGAWNVSDKAESQWDVLTHTYPDTSRDLKNADVACNSYYLWKRDIEMASQLGLQFYRFSISWPRLLPNAFTNYISEDGKRYYNNLIDGLLEKGIEPVVTLYHFELPQKLRDLGAWTNPLISDWFADYARVVFSLFGDRVKTWITMNEPQMECDMFNSWPVKLNPGLEHNIPAYLCNKYLLISHAKAWRIYDEEFRAKQNGKVSITNHLLWAMPASPEDEKMAEIAREFLVGRYSHPIYSKEGGWPPIVEAIIENVTSKLGYSRTRLPPFTKEEIELIRGTYDFYGINYYTSRLVRPARPREQIVNFVFSSVQEINAVFDINPNWPRGYNNDLRVNPEGLRQQMHWLRKQYGDIEFLITENGYSTVGSNLNDDDRIAFIRAHLEQVLIAINEGVNVTGYSYWSLMDDYEWFDGYTTKFGLYEVDFDDPMRKRTPRNSAIYYSNVIRNRSLDVQPLNSLNTVINNTSIGIVKQQQIYLRELRLL